VSEGRERPLRRKQSQDAAELREEAARCRAEGREDLARQLEEWAEQLEMSGDKPLKDIVGPAKPPAR
jgi:hypothetical protein